MVVSSQNIQGLAKGMVLNKQATPSSDVCQQSSDRGFMSVLSMMMGNNGNNASQMLNSTEEIDATLEKFDDFLQKKDSVTDNNALLLGVLQNILNDPQGFQDFMQSLSNNVDNLLKQYSTQNLIDFKSAYIRERLEELLQSVRSRLNELQDMTLSDVRQVINEEIGKLFEKRTEVADEISLKQTATVRENHILAINTVYDNPQILETTVDNGSSANKKLIGQGQHDFLNGLISGKDIADELRATLHQAIVDDTNTAFKNGFVLSSNIESSPTTLNMLDEIAKELDVKEVEALSTNTLIGKNSHTVVSSEAPMSQLKGEQAIRETLHVSRIHEIDTKILKSIQTDAKILTVRLEPPDLGNIHIKLIMTDGSLRADLKVDNQTVKDMMNLAFPQIRNTLENAGIKVSEFSVDIREEYYSDGRRHEHERDNDRTNQQSKRQKDKEYKPFEYYI